MSGNEREMTQLGNDQQQSKDVSLPIYDISQYRLLLLDIEGTVAPIDFIHSVMFPYILRNLRNYLKENYDTQQTKNDIKDLTNLSSKQTDNPFKITDLTQYSPTSKIENNQNLKDKQINELVSNIEWQINHDLKTTELKQLQGHMWKNGFETKEIISEIYDDFYEFLNKNSKNIIKNDKNNSNKNEENNENNKHIQKSKISQSNESNNNGINNDNENNNDINKFDNALKICIYSSGSVEAQLLFFQYTKFGNLLPYFQNHFDTKVGSKKEVKSYETISGICGFNTKEERNKILFISDLIDEIEAASNAGLDTLTAIRPGNKPLPDNHNYNVIYSFDQLKL